MKISLYLILGFIFGVISSVTVYYFTSYQSLNSLMAMQAIDGCIIATKIHNGNADDVAKAIDSNMDERIVFADRLIDNPYRTFALTYLKQYVETHGIKINQENLKIMASLPIQPPTQCQLRGISNH